MPNLSIKLFYVIYSDFIHVIGEKKNMKEKNNICV